MLYNSDKPIVTQDEQTTKASILGLSQQQTLPQFSGVNPSPSNTRFR
jgi:hypothetical protein